MPPPPGGIEPMAKDLVDEETDYASDYDMETSLYSSPAGSSSSSLQNVMSVTEQQMPKLEDNAEILPSIEELTKSMQDLTEQDLIPFHNEDMQNKNMYCYETQQYQKTGGTINCSTSDVLSVEDDKNVNEFQNSDDVSNEHNTLVHSSHITKNENDISTDIMEPQLVLKENNLNDMDNVSEKYITGGASNESKDNAKWISDYHNTSPSISDVNKEKQRHRHASEINKLQDEIDNLLAPLSTDVSMRPDDVNVNNMQIGNIEYVNYHVGASLHTVEHIEDNATKKHFVTPSTTKIDVSEIIINLDDNELQHGSYTQAEKRARLASISSNSSSTCSSTPFELCDVHEGVVVVEHAVIESPSSGTD